METQKDAVMALVEEHRRQGRTVGEVLASLGVKRSTYDRWKRGANRLPAPSRRTYPLTPEECAMIDAVCKAHPEFRHRRIQGVLQGRGTYLSSSAIYGYLKGRGRVAPYDRRSAP